MFCEPGGDTLLVGMDALDFTCELNQIGKFTTMSFVIVRQDVIHQLGDRLLAPIYARLTIVVGFDFLKDCCGVESSLFAGVGHRALASTTEIQSVKAKYPTCCWVGECEFG